MSDDGFLLHIVEQQISSVRHALCLDGDVCRLAVIEEGYVGMAVGVELQVWVPIKRPSIVLLPFLGRIAVVVGMIEVFAHGETLKDIPTVAIHNTLTIVRNAMQVYAYTLIGIVGGTIGGAAWMVIRIDSDVLQVGQFVVSIELDGGDEAGHIPRLIARFEEPRLVAA